MTSRRRTVTPRSSVHRVRGRGKEEATALVATGGTRARGIVQVEAPGSRVSPIVDATVVVQKNARNGGGPGGGPSGNAGGMGGGPSAQEAAFAAVNKALGGSSGQRIEPLGGTALQDWIKKSGAFEMNSECWVRTQLATGEDAMVRVEPPKVALEAQADDWVNLH